jgi:hypothetical protein
MIRFLRLACAAALLPALPGLTQVLPVAAGPGMAPAPRRTPAVAGAEGYQVVGRGPVSWTRSTGLAVFRGVDGRDYAYTGTDGRCENCVKGRLYVWDVSRPEQPALVDSVVVDASVISDVAVNPGATLAVLSREGAESRRNGLVFLDLAQPAHPRVAGEFWEGMLGGARHPVWADSLVYVVDVGSSDMVVVNTTNLADPREVGRWGIPYSPDKELHQVSVDNGIAYLAYDDDGLIVLDVGRGVRDGTLRRPRMLAQFTYRTEWRGGRWGRTHWSVPYNGPDGRHMLFVADEIIPSGASLSRRVETAGYLHVVDISNPSNPREVAHHAIPGSGIRAMWMQGDTLLLAAHGAGVRAMQVSGDLRGAIRDRELGWFALGDSASLVPGVPYAWDVAGHNGLVFATDANSGLWIARPAPTVR